MEPGTPNALADPCACSPATQLVAIGERAVPALVQALRDRRPTRTIGWSRSLAFSHYYLRVRDVALQVLQRISDRSELGLDVRWTQVLDERSAQAVATKVAAWLDR